MQSVGFSPVTIAVFIAMVTVSLWFDLRMHKHAHVIGLKEASLWSLLYIGVAFTFDVFLYWRHGPQAAVLFLTGYMLEKILSVDNLMVFTAVFAYFQVRPEDQHKILHYGIVGAIIFRLIFVLIGTTSLWIFGRPMECIFGLLVAYTAYKMVRGGDDDLDLENRWDTKLIQAKFPKWGKFMLCLVAIELTDLMFSFDSVPTVIAVTHDPVIVYTSMVFAILGLRSLYFVLAALQRYLTYMNLAVSVVLAFIAVKLTMHALFKLDTSAIMSLLVILTVLSTGVLASVLFPRRETEV